MNFKYFFAIDSLSKLEIFFFAVLPILILNFSSDNNNLNLSKYSDLLFIETK